MHEKLAILYHWNLKYRLKFYSDLKNSIPFAHLLPVFDELKSSFTPASPFTQLPLKHIENNIKACKIHLSK